MSVKIHIRNCRVHTKSGHVKSAVKRVLVWLRSHTHKPLKNHPISSMRQRVNP